LKRDVMEDTVTARNCEAHSEENKRRQSHNGSDSPISVGAMSGNGDVSTHSWVDIQSVVISTKETHLDLRVMIIPRKD